MQEIICFRRDICKMESYGHILTASSICLVLAVGVFAKSVVNLSCDVPSENARFDCHPDPSASSDQCAARGCCWVPAAANLDVPYCFFPRDYVGYNVSFLKETDYGYHGEISRSTSSGWPNDVRTLSLDVWFETPQRLHFKVRSHFACISLSQAKQSIKLDVHSKKPYLRLSRLKGF